MNHIVFDESRIFVAGISLVSKQPPRSMLTSIITLRGRIAATISSVTRIGVRPNFAADSAYSHFAGF
jgi:hypothetical protein